MAQYTKSIVSYFDILGFRKIVRDSHDPEQVARKLRALARFSSPDNIMVETFGNTFTNFSDLILRTVPIRHDPKVKGDEGLLYWELLDLAYIQTDLIGQKVLIRGSVTVGDIFVEDRTIFGPALIRAYELEAQVAIAPRVIIDPVVFGLLDIYPALRGHEPEQEMQYLCRVLKKDTDGVWFIDYLRIIEADLNDCAAYLQFLRSHRQLIVDGLAEFKELNSILTKYGWLVSYHNNCVRQLDENSLDQLGASKDELSVEDNVSDLLPSIVEDPLASI
jgi:hypothetical protein